MNNMREMIARMMHPEIAVAESFSTKRDLFVKQGAELTQVNDYFELFKQLKDKGILKGDAADIDRYKTFDQVQTVVDQNKGKETKGARKRRQKQEGADVVYQDRDVTVYLINTEEASCFYGRDTKWCTAATTGKNYFDHYKNLGYDLYYCIFKKPTKYGSKIAVAINRKQNEMVVFDEHDKELDSLVLHELGLTDKVKAFSEYVRIITTEEGFIEWLERNHVRFYRQPAGIVVHESLDIGGVHISRLPVKLVSVNGKFNATYCGLRSLENFPDETRGLIVSSNELTDLKGCTQTVRDNFSCSMNRIESLEGGPVQVDGNYQCSANLLQDLVGAPEHTYDFTCSDNYLESLDGAPRHVEGNFNCSHNPYLKSYAGGPKRIDGNLVIHGTGLKTFEGLEYLGGDIKQTNPTESVIRDLLKR